MSSRTGSTGDVLAKRDELGHLPPIDLLKSRSVTEELTDLAVAVVS